MKLLKNIPFLPISISPGKSSNFVVDTCSWKEQLEKIGKFKSFKLESSNVSGKVFKLERLMERLKLVRSKELYNFGESLQLQ